MLPIKMGTCRACLCANNYLFQVDKCFILNYNLLTNLNVKVCDGLPESFCRTCTETVNLFIKFREKCISSELSLQEMGPNAKTFHSLLENQNDFKLKQEKKYSNIDEPCQYEFTEHNVKSRVKMEDSLENLSTSLEGSPSLKSKVKRGRKCKGFKNKSSLSSTAHMQKTSDKVSHDFFCGLCDESFMVLDLLNKHIDSHRSDKRCGKCLKEFENWPKLLAHRVSHSAKKYCHLCLKRFYALHRLEQHYLTTHFEGKIAEMCCLHCPKKFTCAQKLSAHATTHNVKCHLCSEVFVNRHVLNTHLRTHDPEERYACDLCEYTAVYASVLANHKKRRHKKFSCDICNRKFADTARLKDHTCMDKSKLCPVCGRRIFESFSRHLKAHSAARPWACARCPAAFKLGAALRRHAARHAADADADADAGAGAGAAPRACDYCARRFYCASALGKHRRVHTGERPYKCEKCGKRFTGNSNLKIHMKTHGIMLINKRSKEPAPAPQAAVQLNQDG